MFIRLLLLFTIIPLLELALLIKLGQILGVVQTVFIVILTGIIGAYLAKEQGFRTITIIQSNLQQGKLPTDSLLDGALILCGGLLLITPGVITDAIGFSVLIPVSRYYLKIIIKNIFRKKFDTNRIYTTYDVD